MPEVKVQLNKTDDKKIRLYMVKKGLSSKAKAILDLIKKLKAR